jgi:hypothetical protein
MEIVFERCAGLDVHKETVVACVRQPGEGKRQRRGEDGLPTDLWSRPLVAWLIQRRFGVHSR